MAQQRSHRERQYAEATKYENSPQQVKNREERNKARSEALKDGTVHKGDGMEVDHIKPLSKGGSNDSSNRRVVTASENRSFKRGHNHELVSQTSDKERKAK